MNAVEEILLADQVRRLQTVVAQAREGSVELLFARHVLSDPALDGARSGADRSGSRSLPVELAVYGYATLLGQVDTASPRAELGDDVQRLNQLDPFPGDRVSFMFDPVLMIGVSAAIARAARSVNWDCRGWLVGLLGDRRFGADSPFLVLARAYSLHLLTGEVSPLPRLADLGGAAELGFTAWMMLSQVGELTDRRDSYEKVSAEFLTQLLIADTSALGVPRAAVALAAVTTVIRSGARRLVMGIDSVSAILQAFPPCMERWRWDPPDVKHPVRWLIDAEREVQDILWIMLRPHFDDLVYENPLPKVGHASYRPDFSIPNLRLLIEVKYARKASDFKDIEKQVMEDSVAYLANTDSYDRIIVFIYDDSSSGEHHDTTRRALSSFKNVADVIIASRPGRIPPRDQRDDAN